MVLFTGLNIEEHGHWAGQTADQGLGPPESVLWPQGLDMSLRHGILRIGLAGDNQVFL